VDFIVSPMIKIKLYSIFLTSFLFFFAHTNAKDAPLVSKGKINLSDYDFGSNEIIDLDGEWEFYYQKLYSPEAFIEQSFAPEYFVLPQIWNDNYLKGKKLSPYSYATYRLQLVLQKGKRYGLKFPYQATAFKGYINGELVFQSGNVSVQKDSIVPSYINQFYFFQAKSAENEIILQVANNSHRKGGTWSSILLGSKTQMENARHYSIFVEIFIAGALFIMAFFHFIQYFNRNNEPALLSFSIFYFIVFARLITTGERVLLMGFPYLEFELYNKIEYLSFFLAVPAFLFFIEKLFIGLISKRMQIIVLVIPAIFSIITLFSTVSFYSYLIIPFQIIALLGILYSIYLIYKAIKQKKKGARLIFIGTFIIIIGTVNDIFYTNQTFNTIEMTHYCVLVFSIFQAVAVSLNVMEIENKNNKLEAEFNTTKYLSEVGKQITSSLDTQSIFKTVHQYLIEMMQIDILKVGLVENNKKRVFLFDTKTQGLFPLETKNEVFEEELEAWCAKHKKPILLNSIGSNFDAFQFTQSKIGNSKAQSIIFLPLIKLDAVVGYINIQSSVENSYTQNHLNIIESIIAYAFIAYANAKSFEQIQEQKTEIEVQRDLSMKQEKEITSSINYASRIQHAMLPAETLFEENFDEHFIFFRPRDIVSGDFYWVRKVEDTIIIVAADCTGHGVPGAFVSMLGISILNKINIKANKTKAGDILDILREEIKFALKQTGKDHELRDGMDLSLCLINMKTKELQFAGANNHLYIITKNKLSTATLNELTQNPAIGVFSETADSNLNYLIEIKADRQPIGIYRKEYSFTTHTFNIHQGDKIYMFSDGFVDQFGGDKGHKFRSKYFKELLLQIQNENLPKQHDIIENTFDEWKRDRKQIDDVLVMGIKIKKELV